MYIYIHVHRLACTHITYLFAMYIHTSFLVQFWGGGLILPANSFHCRDLPTKGAAIPSPAKECRPFLVNLKTRPLKGQSNYLGVAAAGSLGADARCQPLLIL